MLPRDRVHMNSRHPFSRLTVLIRGHTLIEVLVVLGIVALILTLVPPLFRNTLDQSQVRTAVRELAAGLRHARERAINTREDSLLIVDTSERSFVIDGHKVRLSLPQNADLSLTTAETEKIDDHTGAIRYFADGSSTGGQIQLIFDEQDNRIDVNWLTGKVVVLP